MKLKNLLIIFLFGFLSAKAQLKILTTNSVLNDIVQNIAGDKAKCESMLPIGSDPHLYEAIPSDIAKINESDVVIKNGLKLEGWLDKVIDQVAESDVKIYNASLGVNAIENEAHKNFPDPHAWMNPLNVVIYAKNIAGILSKNDPKNKAYYQKNFQNYKKKLLDLHNYIEKVFTKIPQQKRILITSHDAFAYYGKQYKVEVVSLLGTSTDAEIQTGDMHEVIEIIKKRKIPTIFPESTINPKILNLIAKDTKTKLGKRLFADSLGDEDSEASTYLDMLRSNTDKIVEGLSIISEEENQTASNTKFFYIIGFVLLMSLVLVITKTKAKTQNHEKISKIEVKNLHVSFDTQTVLSHINLEFEPNKIYGIIGPNGSGKSTLIKTILNIVKKDEGSITFDGKTIDDIRSKISYVPQKGEIDWTYPVRVKEVVKTGRFPFVSLFKKLQNTDNQLVKQSIEQLEIEKIQHKQIGQLSGGQQQRVFIARALSQNAEIIILDEPFVGVDVKTEEKIMKILKEERDKGKIIIMIHHDLLKVPHYFDNVVLINQRVIANGDVKEVFTDENLQKTFAAQLTILQAIDKIK